jgi:hypothetical protein
MMTSCSCNPTTLIINVPMCRCGGREGFVLSPSKALHLRLALFPSGVHAWHSAAGHCVEFWFVPFPHLELMPSSEEGDLYHHLWYVQWPPPHLRQRLWRVQPRLFLDGCWGSTAVPDIMVVRVAAQRSPTPCSRPGDNPSSREVPAPP